MLQSVVIMSQKKVKKLLKKVVFAFGALLFMLVFELAYISQKSASQDLKREFVALTMLSDLAISNEASYIRHRSLSDFFAVYSEDPTLRDYFASSFVYREALK